MIGPDFEFVSGAFQEVPPLFQSSNDGQHLFVMNFIISFNGGEGFGKVSGQKKKKN